MSRIAGIGAPNEKVRVERMLEKLRHRGSAACTVLENDAGTIGAVWGTAQPDSVACDRDRQIVHDGAGAGHYAQATLTGMRLVLERDPLGIAPLYYGHTTDGRLCFASEVKALLDLTREIHELPPGYRYDGQNLERYYDSADRPPLVGTPSVVASELRERLSAAVAGALHACRGEAGAWLSGGLDSSAVAALLRPHVRQLHTYAVGTAAAPDLQFARTVAEHLNTTHHEIIVSSKELFAALSRVIYHLESFDVLLVRSSITNFLAAQLAAHDVAVVYCGEGGDELFAGSAYLDPMTPDHAAEELFNSTDRLHNTALQRVDRCAAAHGLATHVPFLDPAMLDYARCIPAEYKLRDGVPKWILRKAMEGLLPRQVLARTQAKFWEGAGVGEQLAEHAEACITDAEFQSERRLPNGWTLNTKEELLYYRLFVKHFGVIEDLSWMGRTESAPRVPSVPRERARGLS